MTRENSGTLENLTFKRAIDMMKQFWIYKITNNTTGKIYVGQTGHFQNRMKSHKAMRDKDTIIVKSITKYGWENHSVEVLLYAQNVSHAEADQIESYFIRYYNTYCKLSKIGMNLNEGNYVQKVTKEQIKKANNTKYKRWAKSLGKIDLTIGAYDKQGQLLAEFMQGDFGIFLSDLGAKSKYANNNIKRGIKDRKFACIKGSIVIGFREDFPQVQYKKYYQAKWAGQKGRKVGDNVLQNLKVNRTANYKRVLDCTTGHIFPSIEAFSNFIGLGYDAARDGLYAGKFIGKYEIQKTA